MNTLFEITTCLSMVVLCGVSIFAYVTDIDNRVAAERRRITPDKIAWVFIGTLVYIMVLIVQDDMYTSLVLLAMLLLVIEIKIIS